MPREHANRTARSPTRAQPQYRGGASEDQMYSSTIPTRESPRNSGATYTSHALIPTQEPDRRLALYEDRIYQSSQPSGLPSVISGPHYQPYPHQEAYRYQPAPGESSLYRPFHDQTYRSQYETHRTASTSEPYKVPNNMTCELCKRPQIRRELKWNLGRCTAQRYDSNHRCKGRFVMLFEKERDEVEKANKKYRSDAPPVRCNECSHNTRRDVTWDALELERHNGWCLNKKCLTNFRGKDRYEYALAEAKFDEWIGNGCGSHPPEPLPDRYWAPIPEGLKTVTRVVGGMI